MLLLLCLTLVLRASAAQYTTEQFTAGANGWQGSSTLGTGSWTFTGGAARINFADTGFIAIPDVGTLSNLTTASGGAITGNYDAAGIELIGFRFFSATELPSSVRLELGGTTTSFQTIFYPSVTGVWQTFAASLQSVELGGWTNLLGPVGSFAQVRQNVRYVAIRVDRAGASARQHGIDDIFLDRLPAAGGLTVSTGGFFSLRADYLRSNTSYQLQAAPEVTGSWTLAETLLATNSTHFFSVTNAEVRRFWRLLMP
jgi:hypothetical protein